MSQPPVRAVLFDFGGTLFSYRNLAGAGFARVVREARNRLGVDADDEAMAAAHMQASRESFAHFHARDYYLHRELFEETFRRIARIFDTEATQEFIDWFYAEQRQLMIDACDLRPGCNEMIDALRAEGVHVGVTSNIDEDFLHPMLERVGLKDRLDAWTSSEEARSCKPDAAIFEHSLGKAGAAAADTVFVGDSPEHDILGARRLGMRAVLVRDPGGGAPQPGAGAGEAGEPQHVIEDLAELLPIVRGERGWT